MELVTYTEFIVYLLNTLKKLYENKKCTYELNTLFTDHTHMLRSPAESQFTLPAVQLPTNTKADFTTYKHNFLILLRRSHQEFYKYIQFRIFGWFATQTFYCTL
jgi:hypothetical protein